MQLCLHMVGQCKVAAAQDSQVRGYVQSDAALTACNWVAGADS
jgi:hypothetical protein